MLSLSLTLRRRPNQLPPGLHGYDRNEVLRHQRRRIVEAIGQLLATHGYDATTIEMIRREAGVSRRTFYDHFPDKEAAAVTFHEETTARLLAEIDTALADSRSTSLARVGVAVTAALALAARRPEAAVTWLTPSGRESPPRWQARAAGLAALEECVAGLIAATGTPGPAPLGLTVGVGGAGQIVRHHLLRRPPERLPALAPDLTYAVLAPAVGHRAAMSARPRG